MKKQLFLLLFICSLFSFGQIVNIPDANFKARLLEASPSNTIAKDLNGNYFKIDANGNGKIEVSEAEKVSELFVGNSSISSLEGILSFKNLKYFDCSYNQLTSLNVEELVNLERLECIYNKLVSLNVQNCQNIQKIDFLVADISKNDSNGGIKKINISNNPNLKEFSLLKEFGTVLYYPCQIEEFYANNCPLLERVNLSTLYSYFSLLSSYPKIELNGSNNIKELRLGISEEIDFTLPSSPYSDFSFLDNLPNLEILEIGGKFKTFICKNTYKELKFRAPSYIENLNLRQNALLEKFGIYQRSKIKNLFIKNGKNDFDVLFNQNFNPFPSNGPTYDKISTANTRDGYICADDFEIEQINIHLMNYYGMFIPEINSDCTLGLPSEELINNSKSKISFTNPAKDKITFSKEVQSVSVFDLSGKLIQNYIINGIEMNVFNLQNGNYILKISTENGIKNEKLIKN